MRLRGEIGGNKDGKGGHVFEGKVGERIGEWELVEKSSSLVTRGILEVETTRGPAVLETKRDSSLNADDQKILISRMGEET
jgi:hypothetical protein